MRLWGGPLAARALPIAEDQGNRLSDRVAAPGHIAQPDICPDSPMPFDSRLRSGPQLYFEPHTIILANGHFGAFDLASVGNNFAGLRHSERDHSIALSSRHTRKNLKRGPLTDRLYSQLALRLCLYVDHALN